FDWLKPAVDLLDCDISYGIVYGHTLRFELEHYKPYGKLVGFCFSKPNPPARWLEGNTLSERLVELGKSDWTTMGWYALQRTEILSIIIKNAKEYNLDGYHFEKLLVFCQTALSKTRMLDYIYLARQDCNGKKLPYSFKVVRESLGKLIDVCASILSQYKNVEMKSAISMVEDAFRAEIYQLKKSDSRRYLRIIGNRFPYLRELKSHFYCLMRKKLSKLDPLLPDVRFPSSPKISLDHPRIKDIIDIVSRVPISITPLVSIGVPVFNGEKGLVRALDSLIEQDYHNIEIIISDNGSTDTTPDICTKYAREDSRVRHYRSEENRGAVWNFNRVFDLSSGKYFMWAAHDDQRELSFVSACVEKMEQCPDAVLCQAHTAMYIEGREEMVSTNDLDCFDGVMGSIGRYRETLKRSPATAIYGLYRSSAMRKTQMFQKSIATDVAFIQELSLHGEFVQVPKVLFNYIIRGKWHTVHQDYRAIFGTERKPWWYLPFVVLFCSHFERVACASIPFSIKLRLWGVLICHEIRRLTSKVLIKVVGRFCPERWKEKLGCWIYWRWMHSPNVKVCCKDL
ncbi:MAG: glycosyltransferase, partial [Patescibacteria group bacterium]|nr:glycosyltransferase [Patescibacteria group bacterium]